MGFRLVGFEDGESTTPVWLTDSDLADLDDAIAAAEAWIAHNPDGVVNIVQGDKKTPRAVVLVTGDGLETLAPISGTDTADGEDVLRHSRRRPVTIGAVTVRRRWRTTVFDSTMPISDVAASINRHFGAAVDWKVDRGTHRRFTYSRGQIENMGGFRTWQGTTSTGTIVTDGVGSHVSLSHRPTLASAVWIAFSLLMTLLGVLATVISTIEGSFEPAVAGLPLFGGCLVMVGSISVRHRRATDLEMIDALRTQRRSRRKPS